MRLPRAERAIRSVATAATLVLLAALLPATPTFAAPRPAVAACTVRNLTHPATETSLQAAVDDADPGDTLEVRGTCVGSTTISKRLKVTGKRTTATGIPTLDANNLGRVLTIDSGVVRITGLRIINGIAPNTGGTTEGGLIRNAGTLTLTRVTARSGNAEVGGGIYSTGPLTLIDSVVSGGQAAVAGGIFAAGPLTIRGTSEVHHDQATSDGGGIMAFTSVTIAGSAAVHDNIAGQDGGGIWFGTAAGPAGTLVIRDQARVRDNDATRYGGGIALDGGTVSLRGGAVLTGNAGGFGGGVAIDRGTLTMEGRAEIRRNTAFDAAGVSGRAEDGTVRIKMRDRSAIQGNHASTAIGGVRITGSLSLSGKAAIRRNIDDSGFAGVLVSEFAGRPGSLTMRGDSRISGHAMGPTGAGVVKQNTCTGDVVTFSGVQGRVVGNSPRNVKVVVVC